MTPEQHYNPLFFILQTGDIIQAGDEYYNPVKDLWLPVEPETIGDQWCDYDYKPVRRRNLNYKSQVASL